MKRFILAGLIALAGFAAMPAEVQAQPYGRGYHNYRHHPRPHYRHHPRFRHHR